MKFREYDVDEVKILAAHSKGSLEEQIKVLMETTKLIDLQFSVDTSRQATDFYALALIQNKK